ncbi:MAG: hypothetical protein CMH98_03140 [Oceanospirillaceae bacterium]|nr:hypothetical protein [Oceanospirillaceae bacterium]|tara:strand:+ start:247 stop:525 length:279 start_codon:yes stop_codon:yes gene_type:complete
MAQGTAKPRSVPARRLSYPFKLCNAETGLSLQLGYADLLADLLFGACQDTTRSLLWLVMYPSGHDYRVNSKRLLLSFASHCTAYLAVLFLLI